MAISVASVTSTRRTPAEKIVQGTLDFDNSYPTGGYPFTATERGVMGYVRTIHWMEIGSAYIGVWDEVNQKLILYYFDYNGAADGPAIQVPNTTSLAAVTGVPFRAHGW